MMYRLAWTFGLVSTHKYSSRMREQRFGSAEADYAEYANENLERTLLKDRAAMVIFLIGLIIFAYTFLNAPGFAIAR